MKILSVIIPVYNEKNTIVQLLDKVAATASSHWRMELIIVNDGSTDGSEELCRKWVDQHRKDMLIKYLSKQNGGKGSAVKAGIAVSTGDAVIIQDADLEYDPADYEKCALPILEGREFAVYGSREAENRNRIYSAPSFFLGGLLLTWWIDLLYNADLTDEPTCYKTFNGDLIRSIPLEGDKFEWEPEVTCKLLRMGFRIPEVPISYHPRKTSEGKKIKWFDGLQGLWIALLWRFASLKDIPSRVAEKQEMFALILKKHRRNVLWFWGILLLAFLLRLGFALPGFADPERSFMRQDSSGFVATAKSGNLLLHPGNLYHLYPSAFRSYPEGYPRWKMVYENETRAPLYPLWLSLLLHLSGNSLNFCIIAGCLLGSLACVPLFWSGHLFGSERAGILAALLLALHPTAIAYSPVFLPDTLFLFIVAFQVFFFLRFIRNAFGLNLVASICLAAFGALIRPANAMWIFPCVIVILFFRRLVPHLKFNYMVISLLLFGAILFPWILGSKLHHIGWRIDTVSSASLFRNASAMEAAVEGKEPLEYTFRRRTDFYRHYLAHPEQFSTLESQLAFRDGEMFRSILKHPFRYSAMHFNGLIFLPDYNALLRNMNLHITRENPRPLIMQIISAVTISLYALILLGTGWYFLVALNKKSGMMFLLFLLLSGYYLLMPGPIALPRYQLPALPFLLLAAGYGLLFLKAAIRREELPRSVTD